MRTPRFTMALLLVGILMSRPANASVAPSRVEVDPSSISLRSRRDYRQVVITGWFDGQPRDLTSEARIVVANARVANAVGTRIAAVGDGKTSLTIVVAGKRLSIPVTVSGTTRPDPIRFRFDTIPILTKQGCATGSCHGSPHGKGGFSLSLFGYDPSIDRISLTHDGYNRRINALDPDESLMLKKPLLEIPHLGGKRLHKNDAGYALLRRWIYEGASVDLGGPRCVAIAITPNGGRTLHAPWLKQQIAALARFSDGSTRDVSAIATYTSSHPHIASVDANGLVTGHERGLAAISVRYLDKLESVYVTVVQDVPNFAWRPEPESNVVDRLVDARLKLLQYAPSEICGDSVFLRRVSLDLTGLLPTPDETRAFLADRSPDRRSKLIDRLLSSEEFARFWALKQADLMRVNPNSIKDGGAERFAAWIAGSIRSNEPFDRFTREVLTSKGDTRENAPACYFVGIPTMDERSEMTAQIFMGTRIECAKCHNHPFENWTMRDYYHLAAVFARTRVEDGAVIDTDSGEAKHPTTGEIMRPWPATDSASADAGNRRARFADWLTAPSNPLFARVEVNRIWAGLMGRGIVEPVDDFRSSNPPSNPALLDALAQEFVRSGFDRKRLVRLICNSRAYQRSAATNRWNERDEVLFSHARVKLLTAEQLKDAIGYVSRQLPPADESGSRIARLRSAIEAREREIAPKFDAWIKERAAEIADLPIRVGAWQSSSGHWLSDIGDAGWSALDHNRIDRVVSAKQACTLTAEFRAQPNVTILLNGSSVERRSSSIDVVLPLKPGDNKIEIRAVAGPGFSFKPISAKDSDGYGVSVKPKITPLEVSLLAIPDGRRSPEDSAALRRLFLANDSGVQDLEKRIEAARERMDYATERPYPENSVFTATFGQPRRETACVCERHSAPTLLQALELQNGDTANAAARASAAYAKLDDTRLVEDLYLSALCRLPTIRERSIAAAYLNHGRDRTAAVTDLIWSVLNMREFVFRQ